MVPSDNTVESNALLMIEKLLKPQTQLMPNAISISSRPDPTRSVPTRLDPPHLDPSRPGLTRSGKIPTDQTRFIQSKPDQARLDHVLRPDPTRRVPTRPDPIPSYQTQPDLIRSVSLMRTVYPRWVSPSSYRAEHRRRSVFGPAHSNTDTHTLPDHHCNEAIDGQRRDRRPRRNGTVSRQSLEFMELISLGLQFNN